MNTINRICKGALVGGLWLVLGACSAPPPGTFETPEQAVQTLAELIGQHDEQRTEAMFGPGSVDLLSSGDPAEDDANFARVKAMIEERVAFEDFDANTRVALFGKDEWSWPIPLVREGERWRFDTDKGREELLNRRIGANELWTLTTLHELVEAQREYRSAARHGNPPEFAQRFRSNEGKRDGLYWAVAEDELESPLGALLADAEAQLESAPSPYHGYEYRILTAQGPNAPGGVRNYLDAAGLMTGGFAVIAWPAKYGNSGVMSFQMNHQGIVFQRDLGAETATLAAAITHFDPDSDWTPTGDSIESAEDSVVIESN